MSHSFPRLWIEKNTVVECAIIRNAVVLLFALFQLNMMALNVVADEPIITKNDTFFIPFTAPSKSQQAGVVELYVSGDRGENWTLYQQRGPKENRFSFRAGVDGEFWFSIRTIDSNGTPTSRKKHAPQMKVIVDQTPPKFELTANLAKPGQVHADWRILDANCIPASVRFEYKTGSKGPWQALSIHGGSTVKPDGTIVGQVDWSIPQSAQDVFIRAEARDKADNLTVLERQIASSPAAQTASLPLPAKLPQVVVAEEKSILESGSESSDAPSTEQVDALDSSKQPTEDALATQDNSVATSPTQPKQPDWLGSPNAIINEFVHKGAESSSDGTQSTEIDAGPVVMTNQYWEPKPTESLPATSDETDNSARGFEEVDSNLLPPPTPTWTQLPPPGCSSPRLREADRYVSTSAPNALIPPKIGATTGKAAVLQPPVAKSFSSQESGIRNDSNRTMNPNDWRISNSRKFHLDYSVDASNSDKVHRV